MSGLLERIAEVRIAADGTASAQLSVPFGETWTVTRMLVTTRIQTPPPAACAVYRGRAQIAANLIASTTNGNANAATGGAETFHPGEAILAVWSDAVPNDTARLEVHGSVEGQGYR